MSNVETSPPYYFHINSALLEELIDILQVSKPLAWKIIALRDKKLK
jgi:DNA uptake protein ComE-like DNA-binding protein